MDGALIEQLATRIGGAAHDGIVIVPVDLLANAVLKLRVEEGYEFLRDITAVDWLDRRNAHGPTSKRFDVVYQFANYKLKTTLSLKIHVDADDAVQTLTEIHPGAGFLEREVYDLFGIRFAGHPDLRRILLSDDWEGHPLRKDYPVTGYDMWTWDAHR